MRTLFCFNPHTYMRCDCICRSRYGNVKVSIHTPTWGVTLDQIRDVILHKFQSTHLHEVWRGLVSGALGLFGFQSTHLHEVWPLILLIRFIIISFNPHTYMRCDFHLFLPSWSFLCFNPHTYMRCDGWHSSCYHFIVVSIHTPTWGVTCIFSRFCRSVLFQSTHLHEVWHCRWRDLTVSKSFNPHTYMRCDLTTATSPNWELGFNPHTYMRCDNRIQSIRIYLKVSIHTPTWGVT